jgi:hypothetical protein
MGVIEEGVGAVLGILVLVDIFLQILYARANQTIISTSLANFMWRMKEFGWLRESAAVDELWEASMMELKTLASNFAPEENKDQDTPLDPQKRDLWQRRYHVAVKHIEQAGIKTSKSGMEKYISLRSEWDRYIIALVPHFTFGMDEIDPALAKLRQ